MTRNAGLPVPAEFNRLNFQAVLEALPSSYGAAANIRSKAMTKKLRLQSLKPRLQTLGSRIKSVAGNPASTPRLRGRAGVERRAKWLAKHPLCVDCEAEGITRMADEVDHEVPLWKGGADDETNFTSRCKDHHAAKTACEAAERASGGW